LVRSDDFPYGEAGSGFAIFLMCNPNPKRVVFDDVRE
jgi:hypothetical protein